MAEHTEIEVSELKDIVVIYHGHCQDGFGAAFSAFKKFGDTASYLPCSDRYTPPEGLADKEVYILDFSYPLDVLQQLEKSAKKLVIIDHHLSAKYAVESIREHIFSLEHSGAYLSWQYFVGTEVPYLIELLQIIDLAKDKNGEKSDLITYILSKQYEFDVYEQMLHDFSDETKMSEIARIGKFQSEYLTLIVDAVVNKPDFAVFEGYTVPCVNFSLPINERSIALAKLYTLYPPFAMSYRYDNGFIKVSLRGNGDVDLAEIAARYGGGGHKGAAGFIVETDSPISFLSFVKREKDMKSAQA